MSEMEKSTYFQGKKRLAKFDLFLIKITKKEIEDQIKKWIGFWGKKGLEIRSKRDCPIRFWSFPIKIVTTMGSREVPERFLYKRDYNLFLDHSTELLRKWTLGTDTVIIAKYISTCECNRISFEASLKWICWVGLVQSAKKSWFGVKGVVFLPQTLKVIFTLPPYTSSTHFFTTPSHPTHAHMMHFMNP